jgi:hypothetical protein
VPTKDRQGLRAGARPVRWSLLAGTRRRRSLRASVRALNRAQQEEIEATPTERRFTVNGAEWRASIAGESAYGTGAHSAAYLVAIRFQGPDDENPSREALLPRGRLEMLYDEEFAELLERATRI